MPPEHDDGVTRVPGVWRRHDPTAAPIPLVFDSPHSGETYPDDFDHRPARSLLRQAEDAHVARLWSHVAGAGATLLEAEFPRAYIDPNRSVDDIDPALLADPWPEPLAPSRKAIQGIGLASRSIRASLRQPRSAGESNVATSRITTSSRRSSTHAIARSARSGT